MTPTADNWDMRYEPPALVEVGPIENLTLGGGADNPGDASATYLDPASSDARLKRSIKVIRPVLARLRKRSLTREEAT